MSHSALQGAFQRAHFTQSAQTLAQCPIYEGLEVAFVGRSNVGKSSMLNTLTHQKALARTSKTPGRTQLINFFALDEQRYLVDLPGYGYAKVSKEKSALWQRHLSDYLKRRENLAGLVLLIDARHGPKDSDLQLLEWCLVENLPVYLVLTKADKLSRHGAKQTWLSIQKQLPNQVKGQLFSSHNKEGLQELQTFLAGWLQMS